MADDVSIKISADSSPLSAGLAKAKNAVDGFKEEASKSFKEVAGDFGKMLAAGAIIEGFKSVAENMDRVQKLSIRFGESAESIQRVSEAAKLSGSDMETVAKAMTKVNANAVEALKGSDQLADSFSTLGIDAKDFVDLPMEEKLSKLAEAYDAGQGNAEKMEAVQKVLGKSSAELIPLFSQGSEALKAQFASANVASQDTVDNIAEVTETIEHSLNTIKTWGADILGFFIDVVKGLTGVAAMAWAFVSNLTHGFAAAKQAALEARQATLDVVADERQEEKEKRTKGKGTADTLAANEARKAKDEQDGKDREALENLTAKNLKAADELAHKEEDAATRKKELTKQVADLERQMLFANIDGQKMHYEELQEQRLAALKDLDTATKQVDKEQAEADKAKAKEDERAAKDKAKVEIEAKKAALTDAEKKLSILDHNHSSFTVDSLRSIGGGLAGANYQAAASKEDLQRQAINFQKQTVEELKKAVKALEDKSRNPTTATGDGSFSL